MSLPSHQERDAPRYIAGGVTYTLAAMGTGQKLKVSERPFFFQRGDVQLFAMLHAPPSSPHSTAYLLSHPFAEEKLWSHRVFVTIARALALRGHVVLRFDYSGAGDSGGDTATAALPDHQADLLAAAAAVEAYHQTVRSIGLIGLRLGATVAALVAESSEGRRRFDGAPLVLWDPVLDGDAYLQELLRINLSTQLAFYGRVKENREALLERVRGGGTVDVDGYALGKPLVDTYGTPALLTAAAKEHSGPVLVAQIAAASSQKDREDLKRLATSYRQGTFTRVVEQPFWREIKKFYARADELQNMTLNWLESIDGASGARFVS